MHKSLVLSLALLSASVSYALPSLSAGINLANRDLKTRPQDDFYQYTNGAWLAKTQIPADKGSWGAFNELRESSLDQLQQIMSELIKVPPQQRSLEQNKLVDLYHSYMDEGSLNKLAAKPIQGLWSKVDRLSSVRQIPQLIAELAALGVNTPYSLAIHQDAKNSALVVADLYQDGLGLPDRDYYLNRSESAMLQTLQQYQQHITQMLTLAGADKPAEQAAAIVKLESQLAAIQWTKVANRDPQKTYNKYLLSQLGQLTPSYPWREYLAAAELTGKVNYLIISQPSYFKGFNQLLTKIPLATWQEYFRWQILSSFAADLSTDFVNEDFAFYGTLLRGVPKNEPRWKRGINLLNQQMGEALGKLYVAKYFPEQNKQRMALLVANLIVAYRQGIADLDWMSLPSKKAAQAKLSSLMLKIGYPEQWLDYTGLEIQTADLVGNLIRANRFEYHRNINKLGHPVDRREWEMTPQTVNAYYNPEKNEIVFPAAILQPPFFNVAADDAVNYGGIGAVIGHEISHAFDDQGSQYDARGNLRDWLTKQDHQRFQQKTALLVKQYAAYVPVPGYPVNGELTLGENIADNSGLKIAFKAYQLSLANESAAVLAGLSGSQRFYSSWASVWRAKLRQKQQLVLLKSDPHSPAAVRANATLCNQEGFYQAYWLKPGDKMYLESSMRVNLW